MTTTRPPFDLTGPLPSGTTVLEASAGTGKTHAIAALATRMIAEGEVDLSGVMLVTFGRMATNELRLRVRERLARTERRLADPSGGSVEVDDVERLLLDAPDEIVAARHARVRAALADFDAATIATTHEFCQTMLAGLGLLGDHENEATFTESLGDLTREIAAETYLRRYAADDAPPAFDFDQALRLASDAVEHDAAPLVPAPVNSSDRLLPAEQRVAFAVEVRAQVTERKRQRRLYSYDDMLSRLQDCLTDPVSGPEALDRLRSAYPVVLVDEFQDTDPVQWDILRRAFHGHARLILIGDPKQAIYAFRGADVYSYLDAVSVADTVATLDVNWRSDEPLVRAVQAITGQAALGDPRIVVRPVRARHTRPRLRFPAEAGTDVDRPVRIRVRDIDPEAERLPSVGELRTELDRDLADDVASLLTSGARLLDADHDHQHHDHEELDQDDHDHDQDGWRPLGPGDVAVLVRSNKRLEPIRAALAERGVPAVIRGAGSVFDSDVASDWLRLLRTLEQPRQTLIRDLALTRFVGWDVAALVSASEDDLNRLAVMVRRWARVLAHQGVAALLETVTDDTRIAARLLSRREGERDLTDLRHVGQSLHAAMTLNRLGVGALIAWLQERIAEARRSTVDDVSRRLETDGEAVQILTIHRSKGLEFPVVYLPEAWDRWLPDDKGNTVLVHDPAASDDPLRPGPVVCDVGGERGPGRRERLSRMRQEDAGEDLRLYYVAMTRARCQLITWWMPSVNTVGSALQRYLFRDPAAGDEPEQRYEVTTDPRGLPQLDPALFSLELMRPREVQPWQPESSVPGGLAVRRFDRMLDLSWRRTSYSALTAAAHGLDAAPVGSGGTAAGAEPGVGSEPEAGREDDESAAVAAALDLALGATGGSVRPGGSDDDHSADPVSPMDDLPLGAAFGTVVHALLEEIDPQAADLEAELITLARAELARGPAGTLNAEHLGSALVPALQTPLGPLAGDLRLCDIAKIDRLPELTFELPLAGGDRPSAAVTLGDLVPVLRRHLGPDDPLRRYPDLLEAPMLAEQPLRGYLNGSIDAVLRVRTDGQPRYLVVDYKTNWLGSPELRPLRVRRYGPEPMGVAMMQAHYPLQALLYAVALHRYLRWRQPDYDPSVHLGGVLYLFLRGMAGDETPRVDGVPCGVFSWRPSAGLIMELSDLLDGERR